MGTVWKYDLPRALNHLDLPAGARVLHADEQHGLLRCWVLVDPVEARRERVTVEICGTGTPCPPATAEYLNTFLVGGGDFVFHAFVFVHRTADA